MNEASATLLAEIADAYALRWSAQRPPPDKGRPASRAELRRTIEANEVFLCLTEFLPDHPRGGIPEWPEAPGRGTRR